MLPGVGSAIGVALGEDTHFPAMMCKVKESLGLEPSADERDAWEENEGELEDHFGPKKIAAIRDLVLAYVKRDLGLPVTGRERGMLGSTASLAFINYLETHGDLKALQEMVSKQAQASREPANDPGAAKDAAAKGGFFSRMFNGLAWRGGGAVLGAGLATGAAFAGATAGIELESAQQTILAMLGGGITTLFAAVATTGTDTWRGTKAAALGIGGFAGTIAAMASSPLVGAAIVGGMAGFTAGNVIDRPRHSKPKPVTL